MILFEYLKDMALKIEDQNSKSNSNALWNVVILANILNNCWDTLKYKKIEWGLKPYVCMHAE